LEAGLLAPKEAKKLSRHYQL